MGSFVLFWALTKTGPTRVITSVRYQRLVWLLGGSVYPPPSLTLDRLEGQKKRQKKRKSKKKLIHVSVVVACQGFAINRVIQRNPYPGAKPMHSTPRRVRDIERKYQTDSAVCVDPTQSTGLLAVRERRKIKSVNLCPIQFLLLMNFPFLRLRWKVQSPPPPSLICYKPQPQPTAKVSGA